MRAEGRSYTVLMTAQSNDAPRARIAEHLRRAIIEGALPPGHHLREDEVAKEHGVSRVPVREAVQILAAEGFLELVKYKGAVVATPTQDRLRELIEIRQALEAMATRLAAERSAPESADRLVQLAQQGHQELAGDNLIAIPGLVDDFHQAVAESSGNTELVRMLSQIREKIRWIFSQDLENRSHQEWDDHTVIAEAIARNEADIAAEAMSHHVARDLRLCEKLSRTV